jgi:hypothetical protein
MNLNVATTQTLILNSSKIKHRIEKITENRALKSYKFHFLIY